jgi:hypothetical protein
LGSGVIRSYPVFVHYSEIDGYGFRGLEENQHVEFEVTQGPKGLAGHPRPRPRRLSRGQARPAKGNTTSVVSP